MIAKKTGRENTTPIAVVAEVEPTEVDGETMGLVWRMCVVRLGWLGIMSYELGKCEVDRHRQP